MLVAGTVALDLVARVDRFPVPDEATRLRDLVERFGGCAGNVATALARWGHRPTLLSAVGQDFPGSAYEDALTRAGVDLGVLVVDEERLTARAVMAGDPEHRQLILYHDGATPSMERLEPVRAELGHFAPGEIRAYPKLMAACGTVLFDPGQETFYRPTSEILACLDHVDHLFVNQHEADVLAHAAGGLDKLVERVTTVIVTDATGQTLHGDMSEERVEGVPADVVDTTGAGDAHRAGVVHGLHRGWDLATACRFGSVVAACVVEHAGAQEGLPSLEEALARYERAYGGPPA